MRFYQRHPEVTHARGRGPVSRGFTLVEMLIVVMVLSILAALVYPEYRDLSPQAEATAAGTSMQAIAKATNYYFAETGQWPQDKNRRVLPTELLAYLKGDEFEMGPLGGVWDYEDWRGTGETAGGDDIGIAISIVEGDEDLYDDVDEAIDDGDLETRTVRYCESSPRLVYIILFD